MFPWAIVGVGGVALTSVANAGVLALLAAKTWLLLGEKASSSTRNCPPPVLTIPCTTGAAGLVTLNERRMLLPSPAYSVAVVPLLATTTPSGPDTDVVAA